MTTAPPTRRTWLEDAWYVAARADELTDAPLGRTICGRKMVFFRAASGEPAALEDFCPHRGAPLSLGFLKDGGITCGYHGLGLDCRGKPLAMSGQDAARLPAARAYACVERYGFIWVWPGDAARADAALLPNLQWAEDPEWAFGGGLFHIHCDYRLMVDNLMDLTHETYVHAGSIGQKEIDETPVETLLEGPEGITRRFMSAVPPPPFWCAALEGAGLPSDGLVDRWQICRFSLPSHVMIEVGVALEGRGGYGADRAHKASSIVVDFITPETETTHWYFWGMARNFAPADTALTATIRAGQEKIFSEDLAMLEQQQDNLTRNPGRRLVTLNIDAGGAQSRAMIERAIRLEPA